MILIADSGSTKTDWCLIDDEGHRKDISTKGMNPYQQSEEQLTNEVATALVPQLPTTTIENVYFYGAGCIYDKIPLMERVLRSKINILGRCEVNSDMLGVARALCGHESGIACILGTGSNTCFYDGTEITKNVPSLGFILGDEGSGSVLGKLFVNYLYKGLLGEIIKQKFEHSFDLDTGKVIERVYRQPMANRFLASLSEFITNHLDDSEVRGVVVQNFIDFLRYHISPYCRQDLPVSFVGSVAWYYKDELHEAAERLGYKLGTVLKTPLAGLIRYHQI